jgi:hypothetical protein
MCRSVSSRRGGRKKEDEQVGRLKEEGWQVLCEEKKEEDSKRN